MLRVKKTNKPIDDIIVSRAFSEAAPAAEKIAKRYQEWKLTGSVSGTIIIDNNNRLIDGYTAYLVYKMIGAKKVECLRIIGDDTSKLEKKNKDLELQNAALRQKVNELLRAALLACDICGSYLVSGDDAP